MRRPLQQLWLPQKQLQLRSERRSRLRFRASFMVRSRSNAGANNNQSFFRSTSPAKATNLSASTFGGCLGMSRNSLVNTSSSAVGLKRFTKLKRGGSLKEF